MYLKIFHTGHNDLIQRDYFGKKLGHNETQHYVSSCYRITYLCSNMISINTITGNWTWSQHLRSVTKPLTENMRPNKTKNHRNRV